MTQLPITTVTFPEIPLRAGEIRLHYAGWGRIIVVGVVTSRSNVAVQRCYNTNDENKRRQTTTTPTMKINDDKQRRQTTLLQHRR